MEEMPKKKSLSLSEIIHDLQVLGDYFEGETGGSVPMCIPEAIKVLTVTSQSDWIPITYRPMTEEEEKELCVEFGIKEGSLEDWEKRVFTCHLPDDGQEILVSCGKNVYEDICSWDEYGCGLENNGDWDGIDAWMPKPEPYKGEGAEE